MYKLNSTLSDVWIFLLPMTEGNEGPINKNTSKQLFHRITWDCQLSSRDCPGLSSDFLGVCVCVCARVCVCVCVCSFHFFQVVVPQTRILSPTPSRDTPVSGSFILPSGRMTAMHGFRGSGGCSCNRWMRNSYQCCDSTKEKPLYQ